VGRGVDSGVGKCGSRPCASSTRPRGSLAFAASRRAASLLFSPLRVRTRTERSSSAPGCRRWCRGARPDDGYVTDDLLAWYERFAAGARAARRRGHRHPRRAQRAAAARRARPLRARARRAGRTRAARQRRRHALFLQSSTSSPSGGGPSRRRSFRRYLRSTTATARASPGRPTRSVPRAPSALSEDERSRDSSPTRDGGALYGYRERVTDRQLPARRASCRGAARAVRRRRGARAGGRFRRRRAALRARLHHGVVPLGAQHAHDGYGGRARTASGCRSRSTRGARARRRGFVVGCRYLGDDVIAGGNRVDDAVSSASSSRARGSTTCRCRKGGKFEDAKQPKVGRPRTRTPAVRLRVHADRSPTRAARSAQRRRRGAIRARCARPASHAGRRRRRHLHLRPGRGAAARGEADSSPRRARPRRSRLVPARCARPRREVRRCSFTNYCEGLDQSTSR
jgi:hypothetical protein